jgi:rhodanese-related sulfurtransferase
MRKSYSLFVVLWFLLLPVVAQAANTNVQRITKEELKSKIDRGEDILILDVRTGGSYTDSKIKIKGATRFAPNNVDIWSTNLPKDKEIITYCT